MLNKQSRVTVILDFRSYRELGIEWSGLHRADCQGHIAHVLQKNEHISYYFLNKKQCSIKGCWFLWFVWGNSRLPMQEDQKPVEIKGYLQEALLKAGMHRIKMWKCKVANQPWFQLLKLLLLTHCFNALRWHEGKTTWSSCRCSVPGQASFISSVVQLLNGVCCCLLVAPCRQWPPDN